MRNVVHTRQDRGSTLLLVMILLTVLAAIGAAAVTLSARDRINASAKTHRDMVAACASAAQAKIWAEVAQFGPQWFGSQSPITELTLNDGTRLGPVHYDQAPGTLQVRDVVITLTAEYGDEAIVSLSNRSSGLMGSGHTYRCVARCVDQTGQRQLEVEFQLRTRI
jgi:hypothetical protein